MSSAALAATAHLGELNMTFNHIDLTDEQAVKEFAIGSGVGPPLTQGDFAKASKQELKESAAIDTFSTPKSISNAIREFAKSLVDDTAPVFIERSTDLLPEARRGMCYANARACANRHGGTFQNGWSLKEHKGIALMAFHHCVFVKDGMYL